MKDSRLYHILVWVCLGVLFTKNNAYANKNSTLLLPPLRTFIFYPPFHNLGENQHNTPPSRGGFLSEWLDLQERDKHILNTFQKVVTQFAGFYNSPIEISSRTYKNCLDVYRSHIPIENGDAILCSDLEKKTRGIKIRLFLMPPVLQSQTRQFWLREESFLPLDFTLEDLSQTWLSLLTKFYYLIGQKARVLKYTPPYVTLDAGQTQGLYEQQRVILGYQTVKRVSPETEELIDIKNIPIVEGLVVKIYPERALVRLDTSDVPDNVPLPPSQWVLLDTKNLSSRESSSVPIPSKKIEAEEELSPPPVPYPVSPVSVDIPTRYFEIGITHSLLASSGVYPHVTAIPLLLINHLRFDFARFSTPLGYISPQIRFNYHLDDRWMSYFLEFKDKIYEITGKWIDWTFWVSATLGRTYSYGEQKNYLANPLDFGTRMNVKIPITSHMSLDPFLEIALLSTFKDHYFPSKFGIWIKYKHQARNWPTAGLFEWQALSSYWTYIKFGLAWSLE